MAGYRTRIEIIGDILSTARDDCQDEQGATVTYLIKKANVSYPRLSEILGMLVKQGLLEVDRTKSSSKYRISENGREFLLAYNTFTEFSNDYGLNM